MQTVAQAFVAAPAVAARPPKRALVVSCAHQSADRRAPLASLAAGLAAAALFVGAPSVEAKVIMVQPQVKNFVNNTFPEPAGKSADGEKANVPAASKVKAAPAPAGDSDGFDVKPLVLPISLVVVGGGAFALNVLDPGFAEFMVEAGAKDSRSFAGYEPGLKDTPFYGGSGSVPTSAPKGGKPAAKKKGKSGGLFGKK